MAVTETILVPAYGHTLAGTLREINANSIASRIELSPSSPWTNGEFDSTDLSELTQQNAANADFINANTTRKGHLVINNNASDTRHIHGLAGYPGAPFVYKAKTGDFDVYTRISHGDFRGSHHPGIACQDAAETTTKIVEFYIFDNGFNDHRGDLFDYIGGDSFANAMAANREVFGGFVWIRLKRVTDTFTGYYSVDGGVTWIEPVAAKTLSGISATNQKLGLYSGSYNTANTLQASFDFFRNWPPYVTTSPVSTLVLDSGAAGTVWTPSTFAALENAPLDPFGIQDTIGYGTLKYRIAASETNPPTLSGATLTEASVQALAAITGRYLKIEVTFISANGYELASFAGAKIQRTIQRPAGRALGRGLAG